MTNTTVTNTKQHKTTIFPTLCYRDARAAIRFLVEAFGFVEAAVYGEGDTVEHAQLNWPTGGGVMLGSVREGSAIDELPAGTGSLYIVVDNPDELYERAVAKGATITREMREEDYGSRGFTCRDPEGVHWSFGTYAGE